MLAFYRERRGALQHKLRQVDAVNDVRLAIDRETRGASEHGIGARFVLARTNFPRSSMIFSGPVGVDITEPAGRGDLERLRDDDHGDDESIKR